MRLNRKESVKLARRTDRLLRAAGAWLMCRWWTAAALCVLCASMAIPAAAQNTVVTGTVTDPLGIPYSNGTVSATLVFVGSPGQPSGQDCNGQAFQVPVQATTDVNGTFLMSLCPNASITPAATIWRFTVNAPGIPAPLGTGPQSFSVNITIAGASQSVSAALSAAAPALTVISLGGGSQHQVNAVNVTTNTPINFINGTNTTVSNPAAGNIRIDAAGSGISGGGAATQCTFWTGALAISGDANCTYAGGILTLGTAYRVGDTIITSSSIGSATNPEFTLQDTGAGRWKLSSGNFVPTINNNFDIGDPVTPLLPANITAANAITAPTLMQGSNQAVDDGGAPLTPGTIPMATAANSVADSACSQAAGDINCTGDVEGATLSTVASADGGVLFPNNTTQTVSGAGQGRIIYDNATTSFKASVNGGAYANIGALPGGSGTELQFRTGATAFGGADGTTWDNTNRTLAWAQGTITTSQPWLNFTNTWNNAAVSFVGASQDTTVTAALDGSIYERWRLGGTTRLQIARRNSTTRNHTFESVDAGGVAFLAVYDAWVPSSGHISKYYGDHTSGLPQWTLQSDPGAGVAADTQIFRIGLVRSGTYGTLGGDSFGGNSLIWLNANVANEPQWCISGVSDCTGTTNAYMVIHNSASSRSTRVQIRAGDTQGTDPLLEFRNDANSSTLFSVGSVGQVNTQRCTDSAGDAACAAAIAGSIVIDAADTNTVVSTTSVTANSQILIQEDSSLGTLLGVTCNTTIARTYVVTARTAGTSFTITASAAPVTNPACLSFIIVN